MYIYIFFIFNSNITVASYTINFFIIISVAFVFVTPRDNVTHSESRTFANLQKFANRFFAHCQQQDGKKRRGILRTLMCTMYVYVLQHAYNQANSTNLGPQILFGSSCVYVCVCVRAHARSCVYVFFIYSRKDT